MGTTDCNSNAPNSRVTPRRYSSFFPFILSPRHTASVSTAPTSTTDTTPYPAWSSANLLTYVLAGLLHGATLILPCAVSLTCPYEHVRPLKFPLAPEFYSNYSHTRKKLCYNFLHCAMPPLTLRLSFHGRHLSFALRSQISLHNYRRYPSQTIAPRLCTFFARARALWFVIFTFRFAHVETTLRHRACVLCHSLHQLSARHFN